MSEDFLNRLKQVNLTGTNQCKTLKETLRFGVAHGKHAKVITSFIGKLLMSAVTREKGFEIIYELLPIFPEKELEHHCITWCNYAVLSHANERIAGIRFQVLDELLQLCHKDQEFTKYMVSTGLAKIIEISLRVNVNDAEAIHSLKVLKSCMNFYSSTCVAYKKKIEDYIIEAMNNDVTTSTLGLLADCFLALQQTGNAGVGGVNHSKNFHDSFEMLYKTLNSVYNDLFKEQTEFTHQELPESYSFFPEISESENANNHIIILGNRLKIITGFLTKFLETGFPAKKSFDAKHLLNVVQRCLAMHIHVDSLDFFAVLHGSTIYTHQLELLVLLKSLISCLKQNFVHLTSLQILVDYLNLTEKCKCFETNREHQVLVYEVIHYWFMNSADQINPKLLNKILGVVTKHISPQKRTLEINTNHNDDLSDDKTKLSLYYNEKVCFSALKLLTVLFSRTSFVTKNELIKNIYNMVTKVTMDICVKQYEHPYTSKQCRCEIFKVLSALFNQTGGILNLSLGINIFNLALQLNDSNIRDVCNEALLKLECICQPSHPTLYLTDAAEHQKTSTNNDEIVGPTEEEAVVNLHLAVDEEVEEEEEAPVVGQKRLRKSEPYLKQDSKKIKLCEEEEIEEEEEFLEDSNYAEKTIIEYEEIIEDVNKSNEEEDAEYDRVMSTFVNEKAE